MDSVRKIPKDHYVPQFYLDAFAIEGPGAEESHIYQYMENKIVSPRIKDVASEKHFYTIKDKETGNDIRAIDNLFTEVENDSVGPLKKIITNKNLDLSETETIALCTFFALLAVRTPAFINSMQSMGEESIKEIMAINALDINHLRKDLKELGFSMSEKEVKEQQKFMLEKKYKVNLNNKAYFLKMGLEVAYDIAKCFFEQKHWHLLISDCERVFFTSDNPISIFRPIFGHPGMNAGYVNGTLLIPISPKLAILLRDLPYKNKEINIGRNKIDSLNKNTIAFSTNYIFSNLKSKEIHSIQKKIGGKKFQKTTVSRHKWAPYIFMGPPLVPVEVLFD